MSKGLRQELLFLGGALLFVLFFGALSGHTGTLLLLALVSYLAWTLYNLYRLTRWLQSPSINTPETTGVWDEVYYQLYQLYQRQRNARRKLTSILSRFQESTQALPFATIVLNAHFGIEWFNSAAKRMFELRAGNDFGQRIDNLIRQPVFKKYISKKDYEKPLEFTVGSCRLLVTITAYGSGQYLMIARDITERANLDAMRRDFISNASHELRTPITVISGFVEVLCEQTGAELREPLKKIQHQTERMQLILKELLQLARLESENYIEHPESIDVASMLQDVYQDALSLDNAKHVITLETVAVIIEGNREELRMAFSNLVLNAIRYTPENRGIRIYTTADENGACVGVEDEGIGITYEHIPRLTERFYRVDPGRSRDQGGTGLGLAIVKHVLDRHHAQLNIHSTPGKGSVFSCYFPKTQDIVKAAG
ncbi:MAG: phosphate regulon sensor histidine kinase PhoR [Gammaproteobacteria bacterium]